MHATPSPSEIVTAKSPLLVSAAVHERVSQEAARRGWSMKGTTNSLLSLALQAVEDGQELSVPASNARIEAGRQRWLQARARATAAA